MKKPQKRRRKKPRSADKLGRNKIKCERYRRQNRREANKARRVERIQRGFRS